MLDLVGYYEGALYMIPMYNYAMGLIYRTDVLEDAALRQAYQARFGRDLAFPATVESYVELIVFIAEQTDLAGAAMRLSLGALTTEACIDRTVSVLSTLAHKARGTVAA
jgi:ABC-type glycerol-3-phosphate transport system substrate-binding protein